ncbi:SGNH/GDSL hydrolase family protein [Lysobacter korlensis]|uniref:SGNH/GDSL hydrolase family protein n=1 Tax=Lysobacter korlensis TaxID=553636 RepID=A0ABV6RW66_9GAMM
MPKRVRSFAAAAALAAAFGVGILVAPPQADAADSTISFAFAGDSLTAVSTSWLHQLDDPALIRAGGYAKSGYTSAQVFEQIEPVTADVLVIMLGTNDVRLGVTPNTVASNLVKIVAKVGAPRVVVSYLPPSDVTNSNGIDRRSRAFQMNQYLAEFAARRGWMMVDPWSSYRLGTMAWAVGASADRVHPVRAVSGAVADRMELYMRQAVEGA